MPFKSTPKSEPCQENWPQQESEENPPSGGFGSGQSGLGRSGTIVPTQEGGSTTESPPLSIPSINLISQGLPMPDPDFQPKDSDVGISCMDNIPGGLDHDDIVLLTERSAVACSGLCFINALLATAVNKYTALSEQATELLSSYQSLTEYASELFGADSDFRTGLSEYFAELGVMAGEAVDSQGEEWENDFDPTLWDYLKGVLYRMFAPMMFASMQHMIDQLQGEIETRSSLLAQVEDLVVDLQSNIGSIAGHDQWDDFKQSIEYSDRFVRNARREIARAISASEAGNWEASYVEDAQEHLDLAWRAISPRDLIPDDNDTSNPFKRAYWEDVWSNIDERWEEVKDNFDELGVIYQCLIRSSARCAAYQIAIVNATELIQRLVEGGGNPASIGLTIDISLGYNMLESVHEGLGAIHTDMKNITENDRRTLAPLKATIWRGKLQGYYYGLNVTGAGQSYSDMLGSWFNDMNEPVSSAVSGMQDNVGLSSMMSMLASYNTLQEVVGDENTPNTLYNADFGMNDDLGKLLNQFIISTGSIGSMLLNPDEWNRKMQLLRSRIHRTRDQDGRIASLCSQFSGHESKDWDYVMRQFRNLGWDGAIECLETGRISELFSRSVTELSLLGGAAECIYNGIVSIIEGDEDEDGNPISQLDIKTLLTLERQVGEALAYEKAEARFNIPVPSLQFNAITTILNKIDELIVSMEGLLNIKQEMC